MSSSLDIDRLERALAATDDPKVLDPRANPSEPSKPRFRNKLIVSSDVAAVCVGAVVGAVLRSALFGVQEGPTALGASLAHELPYVPLFTVGLWFYGTYRVGLRRLRSTSFPDLGRMMHGLLLGGVLTLVLSATLKKLAGAPRIGWVEAAFIVAPAATLLPVMRAATAVIPRRQGTKRARVVVLGSGAVSSGVMRRLQAVPELDVLGYVEDLDGQAVRPMAGQWLGELSELRAICTEHRVDRVIVGFSASNPHWEVEVLRDLPQSVHVCVVPRLFELVTWQSHVEELYGLTVMDIPPAYLGRSQRVAKRTIDVVVSGAAVICLLLPSIVIAACIKATSRGPVFFRQERVGRSGQPFRIFKFRTMGVGAENHLVDLSEANQADGPMFKVHDDPRVTKIGRFLRKTSLDELPQFLNVLIGEMSLVGPRPFIVSESAELDGWAARRFDVRPGMTGLWQVSGRSDLSFDELRQLDYAYVASWSLTWDLKILWHTPGSVLCGHGAY
jgi:exopolysaccharide biosynthesis polyprenyl glycosylphosphotransferase